MQADFPGGYTLRRAFPGETGAFKVSARWRGEFIVGQILFVVATVGGFVISESFFPMCTGGGYIFEKSRLYMVPRTDRDISVPPNSSLVFVAGKIGTLGTVGTVWERGGAD